MSGTINPYMLQLYSGIGTVSGGMTSLLRATLGIGTPAQSTSGTNALAALRTAEQNQTQDIATTAKQPQVARDIAAFQAAVAKAKTPADLLANPTAVKVLLTANGLADQIPYTALVQKALLSDLTDPKSLANTLTDTRWKTVVTTYNFAAQGLAVIGNPSVLSTISSAYAEVTWRQSLDATTPGLSDALTFRAEASTITSAEQILGDKVMRNVVTTALGLPLEMAVQELPAQEKAITSQLDVTKLQDPKFVESFVQRYLLAAAGNAAPTTGSTNLITLATQATGLVV